MWNEFNSNLGCCGIRIRSLAIFRFHFVFCWTTSWTWYVTLMRFLDNIKCFKCEAMFEGWIVRPEVAIWIFLTSYSGTAFIKTISKGLKLESIPTIFDSFLLRKMLFSTVSIVVDIFHITMTVFVSRNVFFIFVFKGCSRLKVAYFQRFMIDPKCTFYLILASF